MTYPYEIAVFAERNRNQMYEAVIKALEFDAKQNRTTRKDIAARIGRSPAQVSMWLSGPSNWTLDTINDLLRAVNATMDYNVVFDRDRVKLNHHHIHGVDPRPPMIALQTSDATATTSSYVSVNFPTSNGT